MGLTCSRRDRSIPVPSGSAWRTTRDISLVCQHTMQTAMSVKHAAAIIHLLGDLTSFDAPAPTVENGLFVGIGAGRSSAPGVLAPSA